MQLTYLFKSFFNSEKSGGIILILCTIISLCIANSAWSEGYLQIWDTQILGHSITHWINDGLMAIFFLMIGLELEREIYNGELSTVKTALFPLLAAIGGVVVPALLYTAFNYNTDTQAGAGIPMATDIAFALGVLSLLGNRVPISLKIFLTALAVIDDLCAIIVIAIFYTGDISFLNLAYSLTIFVILGICNRLKVHNFLPYLIGGIAMWYFMLQSGVHATISGVLLAFVLPFGNGGRDSISFKLQSFLHIPVAFIIIPLFALANTAVVFGSDWLDGVFEPIGLGIMIGLVFGKPIGIFLVSFIAVSLGICHLPSDLKWKHIFAAGMLAGIGFTMSIFVTLLAFDDPAYISTAKISILIASLTAASSGLIALRIIFGKAKKKKKLKAAQG